MAYWFSVCYFNHFPNLNLNQIIVESEMQSFLLVNMTVLIDLDYSLLTRNILPEDQTFNFVHVLVSINDFSETPM